ncbi:MAG: PD-(D/E)XK nuclease family protein [Candidatus Omnitrophica bacterium]|nr:PD-(D/E)XK nuclease family protein [Candidatus Omnitrophota bacterium]
MRLLKLLKRLLSIFKPKYHSNTTETPEIGETRGVRHTGIRGVKRAEIASSRSKSKIWNGTRSPAAPRNDKAVERCPYCNGKNIIKWGTRKKKYEAAQLYRCHHCKKNFTTPKAKGKSFPLRVILEGLCLYNIGHSAEESVKRLKEQFALEVSPRTLRDWVSEYEPLCRYSRLRPYGLKLYTPNQVIQTVHLYHRQVYDFSVHRSKIALILQEHKHAKFGNVREFLEAIQAECPHQFFQDGMRASELKAGFDIDDVRLIQRSNFANRIADLALQAVDDNKLRHLTLQKFMLCNDSVTVATEVPVYMDKYDIEHMQEALGFKIPIKLDRIITGHIDILQIRNGAVHIMDYKPRASAGKQGPVVSQLTLYALMLSRLTGLRLYDFKCAWFDEKVYYEFFPLHVVYKLRDKQRKEDPRQMKFKEMEVTGDTAAKEDL